MRRWIAATAALQPAGNVDQRGDGRACRAERAACAATRGTARREDTARSIASVSWRRNGKRAASASHRWKISCAWGGSRCRKLRDQRSHAEVERARNDSDRQHLRETCMSEVNAQPEDLIATETAFITGEELAIAEANYREMKSRIEVDGRGEHDGARRVQRVRAALRVSDARARRPAAVDRGHAAGHHRTGPGYSRKIRAGVPRHQPQLLGCVPHDFRRRHTRKCA